MVPDKSTKPPKKLNHLRNCDTSLKFYFNVSFSAHIEAIFCKQNLCRTVDNLKNRNSSLTEYCENVKPAVAGQDKTPCFSRDTGPLILVVSLYSVNKLLYTPLYEQWPKKQSRLRSYRLSVYTLRK